MASSFRRCLPILNLFLGVSLVGNFWLLFARSFRLRQLVRLFSLLSGLLLTYRLYLVFPFNFPVSNFNLESLVKTVLLAVMVVLGALAIVEMLKLGSNEEEI